MHKKKMIRNIILTTLFIIIVLFAAGSCFIGLQVFQGTSQLATNEGTKGFSDSFMEKCGMDYEEFTAAYRIEELTLTSSFDGHSIPADYIYTNQSKGSKDWKTVILVHGLGGNRYSNYPLAEFFLEEGYNVVTYDQRSSNENTARYTTFGYWEKYDLADWINYINTIAPQKAVGIWATSFGGATAGLAMGYENTQDKIDFLILDSPVSSMEWMIKQEMKNMDTGIPISYMVLCGNMINKLKLGFSYEDAEVSEEVRNLDTPILIINSKQDTVTPYFMGEDIYGAVKGKDKQLWTVEDSSHANIWFDHNQEYRDRVRELLTDRI